MKFASLKIMKTSVQILALVAMILIPLSSHALFTEVGLNYGRKKQSYDANNNYDSESTTASVSFYFAEKLALEFSYTEAAGIQNVRVLATDVPRTIYQKTRITGADLILVFADKKALLQPFVKGGVAQISRVQTIKDGNVSVQTLEPDVAVAPSYGVGLKIALTETFGVKASYSVWQTPIGGGAKTNDDALQAGVTWMF